MIDFSKVPIPGKRLEPEPPTGPPSGKAPPPRPAGDVSPFFESAAQGFVLNPTDITAARKALQIFGDQVGAMEHEAKELTVNSRETAITATEMTGQVKRLAKQIDTRRKDIIEEPDGFVRKVNAFVKPMTDRLKALEELLKRKIGDFSYQQELQRREIERRQREEAAKLQAELDAQAKAANVEPVLVVPVAVPERREPTRSDTAVASTVMVWDFEVQDPAAVPRPYLAVDEAAIRAAVRGGIREIPGVRIFERAEIRVRRV